MKIVSFICTKNKILKSMFIDRRVVWSASQLQLTFIQHHKWSKKRLKRHLFLRSFRFSVDRCRLTKQSEYNHRLSNRLDLNWFPVAANNSNGVPFIARHFFLHAFVRGCCLRLFLHHYLWLTKRVFE